MKLKGYKGFAGGLDTLDNTTGEYTIMDFFLNGKFCYHVAPWISLGESGKDLSLRKSFIGKNLVAIVFMIGEDSIFNESVHRTRFLNAFIVIRSVLNNKYTIEIKTENGIQDFKGKNMKYTLKNLSKVITKLAINLNLLQSRKLFKNNSKKLFYNILNSDK